MIRPKKTVRFRTVFKREFIRYWNIRRQTILTPLLNTYLYIGIFGAALGTRINELQGFPYVIFIIPGLIMMAFAMNAFENNVASVYQQRFSRVIDDQLASPLTNLELVFGYALGGFVRGMIIAALTFATASLLVDLPVAHPLLLVAAALTIGLFFSFLGVLMGVIAESFDNISLYQSFILQPLIFLGGVFYSADLLPEPFHTLTHFNPVFYMINTMRYGFLGVADVNPYASLAAVAIATVVVFAVVYEIFRRGWRLRL